MSEAYSQDDINDLIISKNEDADLYGQAVKLVRNISAYAGLPGTGPKDKRCKHCDHFISVHCSKTYFKCGFGRVTNGKATDIKANAPSCLHFKEESK